MQRHIDLELAKLIGETQSVKERFGAVQGQFSEALLTLGNQDVLEKVARALSVQTMIGGSSVSDILNKAFNGSSLATLLSKVQERSAALSGSDRDD